MEVITKLIEASPYLGFVILYILLDAKREERRTHNAAELESRREEHEQAMQDRQIKHDNEVLQLYASFNQQLVVEIKLSHQAIMSKVQDFDERTEKRLDRLGITQDLLKAAAAMQKK
jgi:hypothetical protein